MEVYFMSETIKTTFSENEFCKTVGISRVTAWRLRNEGKLAHCRIGAKILYTLEHINLFLKSIEKPMNNKNKARQ
jgi:hypothetical protein